MGPMGEYFTAGDVAKIFKVTKMTIYRWHAAGKIPKARRHPMNKYRVYTKEDIEKIKKVVNRGL